MYIHVMYSIPTCDSVCFVKQASIYSFLIISQVEEINTQLKAAHEDEQRALLAECDAKRTSEVMGLNVQYEAELQSVKEELSRVRREGEEGKSSVEQQLASEKDKKQVRGT